MHEVIFDRIELGTYMIAAALVGKKIIFDKIESRVTKNEIDIFKKIICHNVLYFKNMTRYAIFSIHMRYFF